jgi:CBS domain-containing protein
MLSEKEVAMKIEQLMTREPIAVGAETPLRDVAAILSERRISGLPVIGERLEVLGVVSEADIVAKEQGPESAHGRLLGWMRADRSRARKLAARTAGEAMSAPALTVEAGTTVAEAARLLATNGIKRLPVVAADGTLVGIVTRADLVRAFTRSDDEIEREIREDVVLRALWIDDGPLDIRVERGEVQLAGTLQNRSDVELLQRFAARVPGVVSVHSTLEWVWDDRKASPAAERHAPLAP